MIVRRNSELVRVPRSSTNQHHQLFWVFIELKGFPTINTLYGAGPKEFDYKWIHISPNMILGAFYLVTSNRIKQNLNSLGVQGLPAPIEQFSKKLGAQARGPKRPNICPIV